MLDTNGIQEERDLYRAIPTVRWDPGLHGLVQRTSPFMSLPFLRKVSGTEFTRVKFMCKLLLNNNCIQQKTLLVLVGYILLVSTIIPMFHKPVNVSRT